MPPARSSGRPNKGSDAGGDKARESIESIEAALSNVQVSDLKPSKLNPRAAEFVFPQVALTPTARTARTPKSKETKARTPRSAPTTGLPTSQKMSKSISPDDDKSKRRAHVLKDGSRTVIGHRKKKQQTTTAVPIPITTPPKHKKPKRKLQIGRRPRSNSNGSSGSESDDDEVYPEPTNAVKQSAFTDRLALSVPQKRIPKRVTREAVVDTVFHALFDKLQNNDDNNTGSESDEPNESFVKRGLAATLFKDGVRLNFSAHSKKSATLDQYITPTLIHSLITEMRFEDFRTSSARLHILRAIHKHVPARRMHISQALADATYLRLEYVQAVHQQAYANGTEINSKANSSNTSNFDHGHAWTEFLRYAIEHVAMGGEHAGLLTNYARAWIHLCRCHYLDTQGTDSDELMGVASQFVAHVPHMAWDLIHRLLIHGWPTRVPSQQIFAIRSLARLLMAAPRQPSPERAKALKAVFRQLERCMSAPQIAVAKEALSFAGCQFVLVNFVQDSQEIYAMLSVAFHKASTKHWHDSIRTLASSLFDQVLDYAP